MQIQCLISRSKKCHKSGFGPRTEGKPGSCAEDQLVEEFPTLTLIEIGNVPKLSLPCSNRTRISALPGQPLLRWLSALSETAPGICARSRLATGARPTSDVEFSGAGGGINRLALPSKEFSSTAVRSDRIVKTHQYELLE